MFGLNLHFGQRILFYYGWMEMRKVTFGFRKIKNKKNKGN